jgi:hypothetical protein
LTAGGATIGQSYEPISLGYSCEVKYQLSRALFVRKYPDGLENEFRNMLLTPEYGQRNYERHIFDWQIAPFAAVLKYLESDFRGVFERADLHVENGEVTHRWLGTRHPHEFHAINGVLDEAAIDAEYPAARGKFDYLAAKFRRHLERPGPFLYVHKEIRIYDEAVRLMQLLHARNPDHAFKLLFVGYDGEDQMLDALSGEVFKAWAPAVVDKPAGREWEGDNARWDEILRPWPLAVHGGDRITRTYEDSLPASSDKAPPPTWRNRLRRWLKV